MSKKKNRNRNKPQQRHEVTKRLNEELKQDVENVSAEVELFALNSSVTDKAEEMAAPVTEQASAIFSEQPVKTADEPAAEQSEKAEKPAPPDMFKAAEKEKANDEKTEINEKTDEPEEIESAFEEDYNSVSEEYEPEETPEPTGVRAEKRPNKFYLVFAIFIIVMSIVGVYSTASFVANGISEIANQTSLKNDIALFIYPVVAVDPPAFTTVEEMPTSVAIESALWRIILTGDTTNYEKLYNTYMYVPAVDVEFNIRSLFGNGAVISHQTVGSASTSFTYNEDTNTYLVPISPRYTAYSPVITEISNVGELYTVRVKYMPPTALAVEGITLQESATKEMEYTLSKSKNSMTLHSIKNATSIGEGYEY